MANGKKNKTPMELLTAGYEQLIKGKKTVKKGKSAFTKALKNAVNVKQRDAK